MTTIFIILILLLLFGPTRKILLSNWMAFLPLGLGLIISCAVVSRFVSQSAPPLVALFMVIAGVAMFGGAIQELLKDWFGPKRRD